MAFLSEQKSCIAIRAMRGFFVVVALSFVFEVCIAQPGGLRMHALRSGGSTLNVIQRPAAPFYDVVALRVEFQPDTTRFTSGDGAFSDEIYGGLDVAIDPLPHDAAYFDAHLSFLEHYVERASDGRTMVTTHLVPEVIRVSQPMATYSPVGENSDSDEEMSKLAGLVREAWALASQQSSFDLSSFDPETTAFLIFHAGAGRDLELTGTTLHRTPQDLPSLFFDAAALDRLSPGSQITFNGFPVESTILLPETESRLGRDNIAQEDFIAEFSINGFIAASFLSYLGVPDLFNTETGESAIGPFGLMDPLGIFAFNGLFPPEPSAWTKQYLGWSNPLEVSLSSEPQDAVVRAVSRLGFSDAVRIPVSAAEYFLVENRQRAAESNELVLTIFRDGLLVEQRIDLNEENFSQFNTGAFEGGVLVAADPYDWALPGIRDQGERFDGGIVIWHIDERKIQDGIASNAVNADPFHRGVDIEEADGAQDLGFGNEGVSNGTPFDFWYLDNPATAITEGGQAIQLYENRFGPDTTPSSDASDGGPSFVELFDFSARDAEMTFSFVVSEGVSGITPRPSLWREAAVSDQNFGLPALDQLVDVTDESGGLLALQGTPGTEAAASFRLFDSDSGEELLSLPGGFGLVVTDDGHIARIRKEDGRSVIDLIDRTGISDSISYNFILPPPLTTGTSNPFITVSDVFYTIAETPTGRQAIRLERSLDSWEVVDLGLNGDVLEIVYVDGIGLVGTDGSDIGTESGDIWPTGASAAGSLVAGTDTDGFVAVVSSRENNSIVWLFEDGTTRTIPVQFGGASGALSLGDLDNDGYADVVAVTDGHVVAYTQTGAVVNGFPVELDASIGTSSVPRPLIATLIDGVGSSVLVTSDGSLQAFTPMNNGNVVSGFPLAVGRQVVAAPLLRDSQDGGALFALSLDGHLRGWDLQNLSSIAWGSARANQQGTGSLVVDVSTEPSNDTGLLTDSETYNWPNPIREGRTMLRFKTSEDASVRITVVDLSGALVEEIDVGDVRGGIPTEIEWATEASSGVYFARVTATAGGREETQLIRMAIIR